ncbi:MAG: hypothetical protein ACI4T9_12065, partial [Prevotella sp.]
LPAFLTGHAPYYYQLHENSLAINKGKNDVTLPDRFKDYVNLSNDRDLLGNPRTLGNTVDMGCFETWSIADGQARYATATDNRYPHEGSVVYIGKSALLSLGADASTKIFTGENAFMPGYLLLKAGASLYGNGNIIHAAYVAADRTFDSGTQQALMSFPYPLDADNAITVAAGSDGSLTETKWSGIKDIMTYDGKARAAWDYNFQSTNSACWESVASHSISATQGWLAELSSPTTEATTVRFTAWGSQSGDYPYSEGADAKTITLTQYNNTTSTDGDAHFTKEENMGWNLTGLPYLISNYNTSHYDASTGYDMNVPHVLYSLASDGSYTTAQSWSDNTMSLGQGYFMQTAIIGDKETVKFLHQDVSKATPAAKPRVVLADDEDRSDVVEVNAATEDEGDATSSLAGTRPATALTYTLGSDGLKWASFNDSLPEVYLLTNGGTALSLAANAPVGVPMAMGYRAAKDGVLTVSLPDADTFNGQSVWLTDQQTGTVTDLTTGTYELQAAKGYTDNRLLLQIGGVRPDGKIDNSDNKPLSWSVRSNSGTLIVVGIQAGDDVIIRTLSGAVEERGKASGDSYTSRTLPQGVYIVTVNGRGKKVQR